jgi:hypothetical protein
MSEDFSSVSYDFFNRKINFTCHKRRLPRSLPLDRLGDAHVFWNGASTAHLSLKKGNCMCEIQFFDRYVSEEKCAPLVAFQKKTVQGLRISK